MKRKDRRLIGDIIKGIFFIYLLPIFLIVILIKHIIKNKKKKQEVIEEDNKAGLIETTNVKELEKKQKIFSIISFISVIIGIILFIIFNWLAYKIKQNGELTPIILILSITMFVITGIFAKKSKNIEELINNIENNTNNIEINNSTNTTIYHKKEKTITANEKYFLNIIKANFSNHDVRFQVPLSSIIEKEKEFEKQYQNELNRIIDIGIFDNETTTPLLLIEINDNTHKRKDRQARDIKVKNICEQANIKLITFWTEYDNEESYIVNRIKKAIEDSNK